MGLISFAWQVLATTFLLACAGFVALFALSFLGGFFRSVRNQLR